MNVDDCKVGVTAIAVPNGFTWKRGHPFCRLSLSLTPVCLRGANRSGLIPLVDLKEWPEQISVLAKDLRIRTSGGEEIRVTPDLDMQGFVRHSTCLWQRIFTDGSNEVDQGFRRLLPGLTTRETSTSSKSIKSAPATQLSAAIDSVSGAVFAAALLRRIEHRVISKSREVERHFSFPGTEWWKTFMDARQDIRPGYPRQARPAKFVTPKNSPAVLGPELTHQVRIVNSLANTGSFHPLGTRPNGNGEHLESHHLSEFHDLHSQYLESLHVTSAGQSDGAEFTPEDAAKRKLAGIMSFPTLAKYLGLIIDTDLDVDCLVQGDTSPRVYGELAVLFRSSDQTISFSDIPRTAYVIRRKPVPVHSKKVGKQGDTLGWSYEYFGPKVRGEDKGNPGDDGLLNVGQLKDGKKRFCLQTLDVTNAAIKIYEKSQTIKENDKPASGSHADLDELLKSTAGFTELLTRGIVLRDSLAAEEAKKKRNVPSPTEPLYADDLFVGYRIDVSMAMRWPGIKDGDDIPLSACLKRERWRTLTARKIGYGRDVDSSFCRAVRARNQTLRDDGYVRPMVRLGGDADEAHEELFAWVGESLAIPHITEADAEKTDCLAAEEQPSQACRTTKERHNRKRPCLWLCPEDLTVDIEYDLPPENADASRKPAPLREGRAYIFGVRRVLLNGCSLDFEAAVSRYLNESNYVLGDEKGNPLVYRRRTKIHSPSVLLKTSDNLVSAPDKSRDLFAGETILDVVVRSGAIHNDRAERIVVPPRVSFDLAEQSGSFDSHFCQQPQGAFTRNPRVRLDRRVGVFPVARGDGKISYPSEEDPCELHKPSRGSVFVVDPSAQLSEVPYYPDPMARRAGLCFDPQEFFIDRYSKESITAEFWERAQRPDDAVPILLEVRKGRKKGRDLGWFGTSVIKSNGGYKKLTVVLAPGASVCLQLFSVPPGDQLIKQCCFVQGVSLLRDVHAAIPIEVKTAGLLNEHITEIRSTVAALVSPNTETRDQVAEDLFSYCGLDQITGSQRVRVTHAVDRPIPPRFFRDTRLRTKDDVVECERIGKIRKSELSLYPVTITVKSGQATDTSQVTGARGGTVDEMRLVHESWDAYVHEQECWDGYIQNGMTSKLTYDDSGNPIEVGTRTRCTVCESAQNVDTPPRLHRRLWQSQEGGLITFFVGEVLVDRLTTGKMRCEASWNEYGPSSTVVKSNSKDKCFAVKAQPRSAILFRMDDIENASQSEQADGLDKIDLLRKVSKNFRYLAYSFPDGRARRLTIRLVATSRFAGYFPPKGSTEESTRDKTTMWVSSTFRPDVPTIDRILPVFHWSSAVHDGGKEATWKRECSLRVYLGPNWFSSGEGEQLALVCWPNNLFSSNPKDAERKEEETLTRVEIERRGLTDIDPLALHPEESDPVKGGPETHPFAKYGQFVTRWGADPIRLSGVLTDPIGADRFDPFSDVRFFKKKVTKNQYNQDIFLKLPESTTSNEAECLNYDSYEKAVANLEVPSDPRDAKQVADYSKRVGELKHTFGIDDSNKPKADDVCPLRVCILTHDVCFDSDEGRWYADIAVDHGSSYFPFVQLGLARYQEHAAGGLELSYPVAAFVQIPPRRQGIVSVLNDHLVKLELSGVGFYRASTGLKDQAADDNVPTLDVRLLIDASPIPSLASNPNWQPAADSTGRAIEYIDQLPVQRGPEVLWSLNVELPKDGSSCRYGLLVEECEHMAADEFEYRRDTSGDLVPSFGTTRAKRGPLFSHIVDLGQLNLNRKNK